MIYIKTLRILKKYCLLLFIVIGILQFANYGASLLLSLIPLGAILTFFITIILSFGCDYFIFNISMHKKMDIKSVCKKTWRIIGVYLLQGIYLILWCLIPIAGVFIAVYKAISYSFANYILIDSKFDFTANEAISASKAMTQGNKIKIVMAYIPSIIFTIIEIIIILQIVWGSEIVFYLENPVFGAEALLEKFPSYLNPIFIGLSLVPLIISKVTLACLFEEINSQKKYIKPSQGSSIDYKQNKYNNNDDLFFNSYSNNPKE